MWPQMCCMDSPVPSYPSWVDCAIDAANRVREYDLVDATLYAVCWHLFLVLFQVQELSEWKECDFLNFLFIVDSTFFFSSVYTVQVQSTYHPCFGYSNVCQWGYVQIVVLDDQLVSSSFDTWCVPNSGISNPILGTNSIQPFLVSSNGKMCDVRRMLSTIFSQHDDWPIWNQSLIRIAQIHPDEFLCRNYVVCMISSEFLAMQSDWCAIWKERKECHIVNLNGGQKWNAKLTCHGTQVDRMHRHRA